MLDALPSMLLNELEYGLIVPAVAMRLFALVAAITPWFM
jgi:hypothetical protein